MDAITAIEQGSASSARWAAEAEMATLRDVIFTAQAAALALIARLPQVQSPMPAPAAEGRGGALDFYA